MAAGPDRQALRGWRLLPGCWLRAGDPGLVRVPRPVRQAPPRRPGCARERGDRLASPPTTRRCRGPVADCQRAAHRRGRAVGGQRMGGRQHDSGQCGEHALGRQHVDAGAHPYGDRPVSPAGDFAAVSAVSARDIWAVGSIGDSPGRALGRQGMVAIARAAPRRLHRASGRSRGLRRRCLGGRRPRRSDRDPALERRRLGAQPRPRRPQRRALRGGRQSPPPAPGRSARPSPPRAPAPPPGLR